MIPKVSIIIPVYGTEKYIERCARSLFEQTLDDIEYIFVDDCTKDNSITILRQVLAQYENRVLQTKIVRMPVNSGQAIVRRYGISLAQGEYIIHCDSDDWVEPNMYKRLYDVAKQYDCDIVVCDYFNSKSEDDNDWISQQITCDKTYLMRELLKETVHGSLCNKLIKRSLYQNVIYPNDNLSEDLTLIFQVTYFADNIIYIPEPYYHYFYNNESITKKLLNIEKRIDRVKQRINNFMIIDCFIKRNKIYDCFQKEVINMQCRLKIAAMIYILSNNGYKRWKDIFPHITLTSIIHSDLHVLSKIEYIVAKFRLYPAYRIMKDVLVRCKNS